MPHAGDVQDLATDAEAEITWFVRDGDGTGAAQDSPMALGGLRDGSLRAPAPDSLPPSGRPRGSRASPTV
ncbi:hypothetical protein GCM10027162_48940 [Streptomyces incanus]